MVNIPQLLAAGSKDFVANLQCRWSISRPMEKHKKCFAAAVLGTGCQRVRHISCCLVTIKDLQNLLILTWKSGKMANDITITHLYNLKNLTSLHCSYFIKISAVQYVNKRTVQNFLLNWHLRQPIFFLMFSIFLQFKTEHRTKK